MKSKRLPKPKIFLFAAVFFFAVLSVPCKAQDSRKTADTSVSEDHVEEKPENGWYKTGTKTYYYKKGRKLTGWRRIDKKYYYFDKKGVLQQNKIVGSKKTGYYYVDVDGIRVTDSAVKCAVNFVMKYSSSKQSPEQRLRSCFNALCGYSYQRIYSDQPRAQAIRSYALYMFNNKKGNCYRYGSALAYIARVLGFESRVCVGGVTAFAGRSLSPHGWCEVKTGGRWKVCDCSMQRAHWDKSLFLVEWGKYPFRIRRDKTFTMYVKKGKVSWK